ncbi:hypothetical protein ACNR90_001633 [Candidozyma auris]
MSLLTPFIAIFEGSDGLKRQLTTGQPKKKLKYSLRRGLVPAWVCRVNVFSLKYLFGALVLREDTPRLSEPER